MNYTVNNHVLPTFFADNSKDSTVSSVYVMKHTPIRALHYHPLTEIGICLSGSGESIIGNRQYRYSAGCIHIIPQDLPHISNSDKGTESRWIFISIDPVALIKGVGMLSRDYAPLLCECGDLQAVVLEDGECPEIEESIHAVIKSAGSTDKYTDISLRLTLIQFLISLTRVSTGTSQGSRNATHRTQGRIAPALDSITANLDSSDELSEDKLATMCSVSVATLRRLFKKHTGYSPKAFIIRSRMAHAEYLLRKTSLSVLDISGYVGYGDISGFNRTFKSFFGMSPLQYRKI